MPVTHLMRVPPSPLPWEKMRAASLHLHPEQMRTISEAGSMAPGKVWGRQAGVNPDLA